MFVFQKFTSILCCLGVYFSRLYAIETRSFLGAFSKLRKVSVSSVMSDFLSFCLSFSLCLSVRPTVHVKQLCFQWLQFYEIVYWSIVRKSVERIQVSLKTDKNKEDIKCWPLYIFDHVLLISSCNEKFSRPMLQRKSKDTFCSKICRFWNNIEKTL